MTSFRAIVMLPLVVLTACATYAPTGPTAMVLPGTGKSFDQFRADDAECRQYASLQTGDPSHAATESGVKSAAVGTAVGAVAGAAMGGRDGAGIGAGMGLIAGALSGTGAGGVSAREMQRRYDNGYQQCMYAKGHQLQGSGRFSAQPVYSRQPAVMTAPPPSVAPTPYNAVPPPPPGMPPPPYGYAPPLPAR